MQRKAYIITFDKGGIFDTFDYNQFHKSITGGKGLISWWHYLEGTYIIIVNGSTTASHVAGFITRIAPDKKFFVAELNLRNHNGFLPQQAWEWINSFIEN